MTPVATTFFFYLLSAVAVLSAIAVITRRNPVHSAVALIFTLLSLAGIYLMLYAPFVAGVQIILYAGGIMVLFLFVIMLVSIQKAQREEQFNKQWHVGILAALLLGAMFVGAYFKAGQLFPTPVMSVVTAREMTNTQDIGLMLYRDYLLPFEVASLLLLVAIVGAVVMAKKRI